MEFQSEFQNGFQNEFQYLKEVRKEIEPRGFRELHRSAVTAVEELKQKEALLIAALQNVDAHLVSISKVSRVVSVMNEGNQKTWLDLVANSTFGPDQRE